MNKKTFTFVKPIKIIKGTYLVYLVKDENNIEYVKKSIPKFQCYRELFYPLLLGDLGIPCVDNYLIKEEMTGYNSQI